MNFDKLINRVNHRIENSVEDLLRRKLIKIETKVRTVQKQLFATMARMVINSAGAPNLGEDTPTWQKLSTKHLAAKSKLGQPSGFFKQTGDLESDMRKLPTESILGTPLIGMFDNSGRKTTLATIKGRRRPITRASSGKFTKVSTVRQTHTIAVDAYPNIKEADPDESKYIPEIAGKLLVNGVRLRPIFKQYLAWYAKTKIKTAVRAGMV